MAGMHGPDSWIAVRRRLRAQANISRRSQLSYVFASSGADAESKPRRVTDRETLLKLKAEFPQLAIDTVDASTAEHRAYAGHRRQFEWGPLPSAPAAENARSAEMPVKHEQPVLGASGEADGAVMSTYAAFQWGPVPGADAGCAASTSGTMPLQAHAPIAIGSNNAALDVFSWGELPAG